MIEYTKELKKWRTGVKVMCVVEKGHLVRLVSPLLSYILPSFFFGLRGGVTGRPIFIPPYGYLAFFSAGFRI